AVSLVHKRWNEQNSHHWCHTLSNAQLVAVGLLWGETDFGRSICRAVQPGFDTDCNGATVGSIFGMMHGTKAIPEEWTSPLNDTLETGITGYRMVRISELARKGFDLFLKHRTS
ncbi:MAG: ADP-ribosylglycohydrolase family protein, partial [Candidatus Omnitrophica bacterium]|nr:ADP-ribosylglycohydrolase family protein [Candidatus Omnitrophota bacterium]